MTARARHFVSAPRAGPSGPHASRPPSWWRRSGRTVVAAVLALLCAVPARAAPPGTVLENIARVAWLEPETRGVVSNPATTAVLAVDCFAERTALAVAPAGPVAPGAALAYTVRLEHELAEPIPDVVVELVLDEHHGAPTAASVGPGGSAPPGGVAWDYAPATRTLSWRLAELSAGAILELRADVPVRADLVRPAVARAHVAVRAAACADRSDGGPVAVAVVPPALELRLRADRSTLVPGDAVLFTAIVSHAGVGPGFDDVVLDAEVPRGLRYLRGTTRIERPGEPAADAGGEPEVSEAGARLVFPVGALAPGEHATVRYAAVTTPEAARAQLVHRAVAWGRTGADGSTASNRASVGLDAFEGPFAREGMLTGSVFVDRDADGLRDPGEAGVPGAVVVLGDGRGAITDITGRWHVAGVRPGAHVVRVDPATLPPGLATVDGGAEWAGNRKTRSIEVRAATVAIADLPIGPGEADVCDIEGTVERVTIPRAALLDGAGAPLPQSNAVLDAAADWMASTSGTLGPVTLRCRDGDDVDPLAERLRLLIASRSSASPTPTLGVAGMEPSASRSADRPSEDTPFDDLLRTAEPAPHIVTPTAGERMRRTAIAVDVVYPAGAVPELRVNGRIVPDHRIGTVSTLPARGITAARYVGVELAPGVNRLSFRASPAPPQAGHDIEVVLPGTAAELRVEIPEIGWSADGISPLTLHVVEVDGGGVRTAGATLVTVAADGLVPSTADLDPLAPGLQIRLEDGRSEVVFGPAVAAGRVRVTARSDDLEAERYVAIAAASGAWRVVGLAQGTLAGAGGVEGDGGVPLGPDGSPITDDGAEIAAFAQGPVGGGAQLTARIDTQRERDPDRFTDLQDPSRFYPVTGDASTPVDLAPSSGELFVRLDGARGFAQWGDSATAFEDVELARYDRRLYGLSGESVAGPVRMRAFAASTDQAVRRDVFDPDGTSGPFVLAGRPVVARSETLLIETRERFRDDRVLTRRALVRDLDYDLDPEAGTVLLRAPLAPFDADLNSVRLIVLYEARDGGNDQIVAGARVTAQLSGDVEAGATAVYEEREGGDRTVLGADLRWTPAPGAAVRAEVASADDGAVTDTAWKLEIASRRHPRVIWEASYQDVPATFANPSMIAAPEQRGTRWGGSFLWRPLEALDVRGEAFHQEDATLDLERDVARVEAIKRIGGLSLMGGLTYADTSGTADLDASSTLLRVGARRRFGERWTVELSRDQNVAGEGAAGFPTRTAAAVGFDVTRDVRAFLRHEIESGDSVGPDRDRTIFGLESQVSDRTRATAGFNLDRGADGWAVRAATGVETVIALSGGHRVALFAARLDTAHGADDGDFTSLGGAWDYRAGRSLASARYEIRFGEPEDRQVLTGSGAVRVGRSWTLLGRERLFWTRGDGTAVRVEGYGGASWRPIAGRWQLFARLDHALGSGTAGGPGGVAPGTIGEPGASVTTAPKGPVSPGIGTEPGREAAISSRDAWSLSLATGARLDERNRLALTWIGRSVQGDGATGIPSTFTQLASAHWTVDLAPRWIAGISGRWYVQDVSDLGTVGYGAQVGYRALRDLWILGGWNAAGIEDSAFPTNDVVESGPFVTVRFQFDEGSLAALFR